MTDVRAHAAAAPPPEPRPGRTPAALLAWARRDFLARSSAFIMATTVVNSALGAVLWVVAARALPAHVVGLGAALVSAMTLAATLANLGAGPTMVQTIPTRRSGADWSRSLNACLAVSLATALLAAAVTLGVLPLLSPSFAVVRRPLAALVLGGGVLVWAAATMLDSAFIAERSPGGMFVRNATGSALKLAFLVGLVALGAHSALALPASWTASTAAALALAAVVLVPRLGRGYRLQLRGLAAEARRLLTPFVGHYLITAGGIAPMFVLPLLVTARLSATQNAYFYTTWMLCNLLFMVSPAVAAALFAEGSHAGVSVREKARSAALLIAGLLIVPALVLVFGGRFVLGLFGAEYARQSYVLLLLLAASAAPDAVTNVYIAVLRVERRFHAAAALNLAMGLGALVLAWLWLPTFGVAGAGLGWLVMQTAGSAAVALDLRLHGARRRRAHEPVAGDATRPAP